LGVAGAGIALAMQGVLGNVVAGLTIIFTRPFRVGEYISIVGVEGRVEAIQLFSTTLSHTDMSRVVIPNRKIVGEILHNYGTIRQVQITVGVAYDTELSQALAVVDEVLRANPRVLKEPAPVIQVAMLSDSSVNIAVRPWTAVVGLRRRHGEINRAILESFRGRDIVIPFRSRRCASSPTRRKPRSVGLARAGEDRRHGHETAILLDHAAQRLPDRVARRRCLRSQRGRCADGALHDRVEGVVARASDQNWGTLVTAGPYKACIR
jgi:small-conductance mechanosensitive channel